jgi:hypothetical protein
MFYSLYHSLSVGIFQENRVVFPASTVSIDLRPQKSANSATAKLRMKTLILIKRVDL